MWRKVVQGNEVELTFRFPAKLWHRRTSVESRLRESSESFYTISSYRTFFFLDRREQEEDVTFGCLSWTEQLDLNVDTGEAY